MLIYNMGSAILRATGDSKSPLYILIICCVINIILDTAFVLLFHMGVTGVAIATLIAQAVSAILVTRKLMHAGGNPPPFTAQDPFPRTAPLHAVKTGTAHGI